MAETKYKQTEVGLIPEDWECSTFGVLLRFLPTNTLAREFLSDKGNIKNIHYGDVLIKYGNTLDVEHAHIPCIDETKLPAYRPKNFAKDGDIIIADTAEDETVCKATELWNVGQMKIVSGLHTMWCRPQSGVFAIKYLGYFINSSTYHNQILPLIQGIKVSSVSKRDIQQTWVLIPPLAEQHAIASALTAIDNFIASLDKQIAKTQSVKQGAMQQLLTGKTRLKGFSESWETYKIDDLFDIGNGYTPSKANPLYWTNGTIPWFRLEDIRKNGRILLDAIQHITPLAIKGGKLFPAGSFILSTSATIGEHALITVTSLANQRFCFLLKKPISGDVIDTMYFFYYLYIIGDWCRNNINAGGLNAVNIEDLKNLEFLAPSSIEEQRAIASALTAIDDQISALEVKRKKYEMVKVGMMQQLLTGKIRLS